MRHSYAANGVAKNSVIWDTFLWGLLGLQSGLLIDTNMHKQDLIFPPMVDMLEQQGCHLYDPLLEKQIEFLISNQLVTFTGNIG